MMTDEITQETLDKAAELGREMAKRDTWIQAVHDVRVDNPNDFGEYQQAHRAAWEETCQWEQLWGSRLTTLTEEAAEAQDVDKSTNWEAWYYGFYDPAKDAMWDAWEEERDLAAYWKQNVAK